MKYKRLYTVVALASGFLSFAGCNEEFADGMAALRPSVGEGEICFGSEGVGIESRAFTEANGTSLQAGGFKVAAVLDDDNSTMFNDAVSYDSGTGVYRVPGRSYHFPLEGTVSFYGVYPASQAISIGDDGAATIAYAQNADTDLVVADATGVTRQSEAVMMTFRHLLSQVTVNAKGSDATVDYKLKSVTIINADGGTYSFADDSWTRSGVKAEYAVYGNATGMTVSTSGKTAVGGAMSLVPGTISLNAVWECYNKGTSNLVSSNDQTVSVTVGRGKCTTLNLKLPSNSTSMAFAMTVQDWDEDDDELNMDDPNLLPGVFSVNGSGKKVRFSKGNLYWDGAKFCLEEDQYYSPKMWDPNHIAHFYWSEDAAVAVAKKYSDPGASEDDVLFAVDGGVFEGYTVLSADEWNYLLGNAMSTYVHSELLPDGELWQEVEYNYVIDGKRCLILKPDGYDGEVKATYTLAEWAVAEKGGLVALAESIWRNNETEISWMGNYDYWSSTPFYENDPCTIAVCTEISFDPSYLVDSEKSLGHAIRLVKIVE